MRPKRIAPQLLGLILVLAGVGYLQAQSVPTVTTPDPGGTANYIPYFTGASTIGNSGITFTPWNHNVGVGTSNPQFSLDVNGDMNLSGVLRYAGNSMLQVVQPPGAAWDFFIGGGGNSLVSGGNNLGVGTAAL